MPSLKTYRMQDLSYFHLIRQSGPCRNCMDPEHASRLKLKQIVVLIVSAVPGILLVLEQTNEATSTGYVINDLANAFFSILHSHRTDDNQYSSI